MSSRPTGLLQAALRRLSPAPPDDSDADLLGRYVSSRDGDAFAALVRRHGPMVLGVCRRRLGHGPDAEDAYQVTFMVLARDAAHVVTRESVGGWLYRVAYLVALKQSGKLGRRDALSGEVADELPAGGPTPDADAAGREHLAILDEELNALPDKLRSVVVLCGLEERSNSEAAGLLGCPTGTIDSRLSAARAKLRARLARRGLASLVAALPAVGAEAADANAVARLAIAFAVRGGSTDPLSTFADGVSPTMTTLNVKLLTAGLAVAVFGTAGLGLWHATGQEAPKDKVVAAATADPQKKTEPPKKTPEPAPVARADRELRDEVAVRGVLAERIPAVTIPESLTLKELFDLLHDRYDLVCRLDTAAFKRLGLDGGAAGMAAAPRPAAEFIVARAADPETEFVVQLYKTQLVFPVTRGLTVADVLTEAVAQLPGHCSYRVRGNLILVGPAYRPPTVPGSGGNAADVAPQIDQKRMLEQIVGEPVALALDNVLFADAVKELRKLTGANIVIDARCKEQAREPVSGAFSDVRLLTVLTVLADMCELKPVAINNVYYVTTPENADRLQKQANADLFGAPPQQVPAGYVTDGLHLYEKPGNLKPVDFGAGGGLGGGGGGVPGVVPAPPTPKKQ